MMIALVDPVSSLRPSWSPMIGNCASAVSSTASCRPGSPSSTKPRIEEASSKIGKTATKA